MASRPHDADEPPDEADDTPGDDTADGGPVRRDDPAVDPAETERRWSEIVAHLQGGQPRAWSPDPAAEAEEEHFHPPDPGPVLGGDPLLTMAWGAVVGFPLLMLVTLVLWRDIPQVLLQVAGAAFLLGAGLLVWRMPARRDDDEGPGAVV